MFLVKFKDVGSGDCCGFVVYVRLDCRSSIRAFKKVLHHWYTTYFNVFFKFVFLPSLFFVSRLVDITEDVG